MLACGLPGELQEECPASEVAKNRACEKIHNSSYGDLGFIVHDPINGNLCIVCLTGRCVHHEKGRELVIDSE